jgi:hypothetical protein
MRVSLALGCHFSRRADGSHLQKFIKQIIRRGNRQIFRWIVGVVAALEAFDY